MSKPQEKQNTARVDVIDPTDMDFNKLTSHLSDIVVRTSQKMVPLIHAHVSHEAEKLNKGENRPSPNAELNTLLNCIMTPYVIFAQSVITNMVFPNLYALFEGANIRKIKFDDDYFEKCLMDYKGGQDQSNPISGYGNPMTWLRTQIEEIMSIFMKHYPDAILKVSPGDQWALSMKENASKREEARASDNVEVH
jgi:hypothetical protein